MFAKSKQNMSLPTDQKSREKLAGCVYEYLHFVGAKKAAEQFIKEVPMDTQSFQLNEPPGFLASWWYVFWDLYNAAPERRVANPDHSAEARAFQDYLNPGMPYHMQPAMNTGMPPGSNMVGPDGNFYMGPNQMRPPMNNPMGPMGAMQAQRQPQPPFMNGPRYPPRPQLQMDIPQNMPPNQQNMNPTMHRVSPGAARMPGGPGAPPPNAPYGMRPGMPPQNVGPVPMGMPQGQPRPWPPMPGGNQAPSSQAYSTPPPGSMPAGYPPLTPNNIGQLASPVQEMPQNGSDMYGNGLPLQRMPSAGQMQMQSSFMPGQNMDMMGQPGGGMSQAPTPLQGRGPHTPGMQQNGDQMGISMNGNGNGDANGGIVDSMSKPSQQPNGNGKSGESNGNQNGNQNGQGDMMMGNQGGPFGMFGGPDMESDAIMKYKQSLQDDVRRFEQIATSTRNQLTPGSSGPNSVQAQQPGGPGTNGAGLERPMSTGGINGSVPPDPATQVLQGGGGLGGGSGQLGEYGIFQS